MAKPKTKKGRAPAPVLSRFCEPGGSPIHQQGLFATRNIPQDKEIIPYVGEKVSKKEGDRRAIDLAEQKEGTEEASVYMFILDDDYDIDGNVPQNTAKLINHSCDPNCEAQIVGEEIWIVSLREIKRGEELTFDYGFDLDHYEEHPCRCGSAQCIGYIVAREYWPKLKKKLAAKKKKASGRGRSAGKQAAGKKGKESGDQGSGRSRRTRPDRKPKPGAKEKARSGEKAKLAEEEPKREPSSKSKSKPKGKQPRRKGQSQPQASPAATGSTGGGEKKKPGPSSAGARGKRAGSGPSKKSAASEGRPPRPSSKKSPQAKKKAAQAPGKSSGGGKKSARKRSRSASRKRGA